MKKLIIILFIIVIIALSSMVTIKQIRKKQKEKKYNKTNVEDNFCQTKINNYFLEMQFHNDYRDVNTAFDNMVTQKNMFNQTNLPVETTKNVNSKKIKNIINKFIELLNQTIMFTVPNYRTQNSGWDEQIPDPSVSSGWTKSQHKLGLPDSIYKEASKKSKVILVKIYDVEKNETDTEIQYNCTLIIKKINVCDEMMVKLSIIKNKNRNICKNNLTGEKKIKVDLILEKIFVLGYLTHQKNIENEPNGLKDIYDNYPLKSKGLTTNNDIRKIVTKKYKEMEDNLNYFKSTLDDS